MDERQIEEKAKQLAKTLKERGIAPSDTRAMEMAKDIVRTEVRQQEALDRRRFDPQLNPQQRTGSTEQKGTDVRSAAAIAEQHGIDPDTPISALLERDEALDAAVPPPQRARITLDNPRMGFDTPTRRSDFNAPKPVVERYARTPEQQPLPPRRDSAEDLISQTRDAELSKQVREEALQTPAERIEPQAAPARQEEPVPPPQTAATAPATLQGTDGTKKAFGMFAAMAQQHEQRQRDEGLNTGPREADDAEAPKAEKPEQPKVDLHSMFNFSKKK